ncbi:hypothetical protein [Brachybacterium massiliense]|uniref:hypothetical protein n=1 Tax=Brachybacterium massiliense TaxID=1755098 RepID=UPI000B3BCF70|nr:hypothetical protein [Brachybacterium massiliense]
MSRSPAQLAALKNYRDAEQARSADRIEDLEFLIEQRVPVPEAVARVGWTLSAASRVLFRRGHPLARVIERERNRARRAA